MEQPSISQAIHQRIAIRERAILQFEFLSRFYSSPESEGFVLCGSTALHGAYLQGRWCKDLDFRAPAHLMNCFLEITGRCGLPLRVPDPPSPFPDHLTRFYARPGKVYREVQVSIEVFPYSKPIDSESRTVFLSPNHNIIAPVALLDEMMAAKLGCLEKRVKATDFLDLWLGLHTVVVREKLRQILIAGEYSGGAFTPTKVRSEGLLEALLSLRSDWVIELGNVMNTPPELERVHNDLSNWLPALEVI